MPLTYTHHADAASFLASAGAELERQESVNGLMLGIALRLVREPLAYGSPPFLATVASGAELRAAAVMTPPHNLLLFTPGVAQAAGLETVAEALDGGQWPVPGVIAPEAAANAFASIWHRQTGAAGQTAMRMRIYELRRVIPPPLPPGSFRQATLQELELVREWARAFQRDVFHAVEDSQTVAMVERGVANGTLFLWVDGAPASMAGRGRPTPHGESVGPVYTPPERRGRGYASAAVAHLSQRILDDGKRFCTLFADLANPTSNHIYQRIGYAPVADVVELHFSGGLATT
jgi:GNAT superfamily N-acetyltransferase